MPGAKIDAVQIISQRLLTLPETAHYLGCTLWSVRELIWKGQLSKEPNCTQWNLT
jgi:hypothetical protein